MRPDDSLPNLINSVISAQSSDEIMLQLREILFEVFRAEYAIVFIEPEPFENLPPEFQYSIDFVGAPEDRESSAHYDVSVSKKRKVPPEKIEELLVRSYVEIGAMKIEGKYKFSKHFYSGNRYLGFILMYRKEPLDKNELAKIDDLTPFFAMSLRSAVYLSILEEVPKYAFSFLVGKIARDYRLTPTETQILKHILTGDDIKLIAKDRKVSISAVKKVIQAIYRKTGVKRRGELLRLVFNPSVKSL